MVRASLPLALRCSTCGQTIARGKKLYMKKEGNKQNLTFIFKCPHCTATLSFIASLIDGCYLPGEGTEQIGIAACEHASEQPPPKRLNDELLLSTATLKTSKLSEEYVVHKYIKQAKALQEASNQGGAESMPKLDTRYCALSFVDYA